MARFIGFPRISFFLSQNICWLGFYSECCCTQLLTLCWKPYSFPPAASKGHRYGKMHYFSSVFTAKCLHGFEGYIISQVSQFEISSSGLSRALFTFSLEFFTTDVINCKFNRIQWYPVMPLSHFGDRAKYCRQFKVP